MTPTTMTVRSESRALLALSGPLFINLVAMVLLVTVDMAMVGRLGPEALGAVALANGVSMLIILIGTVSLSPIAALVARARGAKNEEEIKKVCAEGLVAAVLMSVLMVLLLLASDWLIPALTHLKLTKDNGVDPQIVETATTYTRILALGTPFGMVFTAANYALRGMGRVRPAMVIAIIANVVNLVGNWALIFGHLGFPSLGVPGCALATSLTRVAMLGSLLFYIWSVPEVRARFVLGGLLRVELARVRKLLSLGFPLAAREVFDRAIFTVGTFIIAQLGTTQLAVNQITLNVWGTLMMGVVALAIAGEIRVAQAVGAQKSAEARLALGTMFLVGGAVAALMSAGLMLFPEQVLRLYSSDPEVLRTGVPVLRWGALFVFLDSLATLGLNGLIALLDTRAPSIIGVLLYWLVSLPVGYALALHFGLGASGLWMAFCLGDVIFLVYIVRRCLQKLPQAYVAPAVAPA